MPYTQPTRSQTQVPIWIYLGGASLSIIAGYVNVLMLKFSSIPVSHMSGAFSRLNIDLGSHRSEDLKWILSVIVGFLLGACLSGLIIGNPQLKPGRRYGITLILEGFLLALATWLCTSGYQQAIGIAAIACGLQNGMASSYYGLVLRTTHVTGIITDIGVFLGQWLRHKRIVFWKLALLLTLALGFFTGGFIAIFVYSTLGYHAMYLSAFVCFITGFGYFLFVSYRLS